MCFDPDTETQTSSDVAIVARNELTTPQTTYIGLGSKYVIKRKGVIKKWIFYSLNSSASTFQVWRPTDDFYRKGAWR